MTLLNMDIVLQQIRGYEEGAVDGLRAGLFQEGERAMGLAKETYVPVDLGNLKASGHVRLPELWGNLLFVELAFGGPAAPYAKIVHENLTVGHNPPTQAKYLQRAIDETRPGMENRIAKLIVRRAKNRAGIS